MSSAPRSRAESYTFAPEPVAAFLTRQGWDDTMIDIAGRLLSLEARDASYEEVVDRLKTQALAVITNSLTTEIEVSRYKLAELETAYDEIAAGGIAGDRVTIAPIDGFAAANVQAAIALLITRVAAVNDAIQTQRRLTTATLFLGGL